MGQTIHSYSPEGEVLTVVNSNISSSATSKVSAAAIRDNATNGSDPGQRRYKLSADVVMLTDPNGAPAEAVRVLRTHLLAQHFTLGRRGLAVCSPSVDTGGTRLAVNLAVAFAQIGLSTVLIDADVRTPGVSKLLTIEGGCGGLNEYLRSETLEFAQILQPGPIENLSVVFAGSPAPSPEDILGRPAFKHLVDSCLRDFDVTIIDTPPANSSYDVRRVSSLLGYAIIVTRRGRTLVSDVKTLINELGVDHAKVIGTVMAEG